MADPQTRKLARQLVGLENRLKNLETVPQLAHSSIDDAAVPVYDSAGNLVSRVGKQADGTWGAPPLAGPIPPAPTGLTALGGAGIIHIRWAGTYAAEAKPPLDFDALEILIDGALAGAIPNRDGGTVTIAADPGLRYVSARIRTLVPRHSPVTSPFSVEVREPAEVMVDRFAVELDDTTARAEQLAEDLAASLERLSTAEQNLTTLRDTTLPAMREALEGADQEASEALTAALQRLADAEGAITTAQGDLTSLRSLLDNTDLADLEARLAAALADIEHFQTVTMPALDQRLADAEQIIAELEGVDIADLTLRLGVNETGLAELRDTTLPALEQTIQDRITTTRSELDGELAAAAGQIGQARQELDTTIGRIGEQDATLAAQDAVLAAQQARIDEVARMTSRGLLPPKGAPLGSHWITPAGHLYVRVPCEEVA